MAVLTYKSVELRDIGVQRWFDLTYGIWGGLEVRGEDVVVPGLAGRYPRNRVKDRRVIVLHGYVLATSEANYKTTMDALETVFDPSLVAGNLVVNSPYLISSGTKTISARYVSDTRNDLVSGLVTEFDVTMECIATPPDWT